MTPEQARIVNTTIHKYIRQEEPAIMRNRKLLALMQARGRVTFNHGGDLMDWKVRYKRAPIQGFAENDVLTFTQRNRHKSAQLEWRGYAATDSMTKRSRLMNKSTEAIIKIYENISDWLIEDIEDQFCDELYIDGNASGNSKRVHGIESFMGNSGAASGGFVGDPSDTYAGLTTGLADYGGNWTGDWPTGTGDAEYDFWSPLIVDYTDTSWAASTKTWPNTCEEALRYGIIKGRRNKSQRGMMDLAIFNDELFRQFLDKLSSKEQIIFQKNDSAKASLIGLGYSDVVNFDGVEVTFEYGVPSGVGYGWNMDHVELCSMQGELFVPEGPDWSISTQSFRFSIDFFGNLKFKQIRHFVKWMKIT